MITLTNRSPVDDAYASVANRPFAPRRFPSGPAAGRHADRQSPRRAIATVRRRGPWGMLALGLALLSCYGTLALVALLSALGVTLAVDEGVWAGAIVAAAALTTAIVAAGRREYRSWVPLALALSATATLGYAMFVDYSFVAELVGFALLSAAVVRDHVRRRRRSR